MRITNCFEKRKNLSFMILSKND